MKEDDSLWATGANDYGQLGVGLRTAPITHFVKVFSGGAIAVAAGGADGGHSMVLKQDGSVWATGKNMYGQLGDTTNAGRNVL